ncbi:MAG: VPLPA-CTERM sorting domain-containing protein [Chromatiales bacterium]|nr:MAG: VPLPA-CTERM sorting domain-containing protein [Chromatiales bacterium]
MSEPDVTERRLAKLETIDLGYVNLKYAGSSSSLISRNPSLAEEIEKRCNAQYFPENRGRSMQHLAKAVLLLTPFVMPGAHAATIVHNGVTYEVVDWQTTDGPANIATGTAGSVGVTFEPYGLSGNTIFSGDFATDTDFDAVTYPSGSTLESLRIAGHGNAGGDGQSDQLTLSTTVSSVLIILGLPSTEPGTVTTEEEFGTSQWDFADNLSMSIVDAEVISSVTALRIDAGNILLNPVLPIAGNHSSGIVAVDGSFNTLAWTHVGSGLDELNVTFAIGPTVVPAPASVWLLGTALGVLGWKRHRSSRVKI